MSIPEGFLILTDRVNRLLLDDAREKIEDFRWEYNHFRPHRSIKSFSKFSSLQCGSFML
jgi:hypothetical protein